MWGMNTEDVKRKRRPVAGERESILAEWEKAGKTVNEMAASTGWSQWTLYRWRERARRGEAKLGGDNRVKRASQALVSVPAPTTTRGTLTIVAEVTTPQGVVRLASGAAPSWASELIRELNRC